AEAAEAADEAVVADYDEEAAEETADEEPVAHPAD
ncbi:transmembrane protein, partial [Mycolicibacter kumamotonensis]